MYLKINMQLGMSIVLLDKLAHDLQDVKCPELIDITTFLQPPLSRPDKV